jgi:hypothetical protein
MAEEILHGGGLNLGVPYDTPEVYPLLHELVIKNLPSMDQN